MYKNTPLETFWKQCQQISVVYIKFEKHTFRRCLYQYKGWKPFWIRDKHPPPHTHTLSSVPIYTLYTNNSIHHRSKNHILNSRYPHSVQCLFIHSKPTIQYITVARITAAMIFLKDNILVTERDAFSSSEGHFVSRRSREPEVINMQAQL
jgi:hypothetical protein